MTLIKSVVVCFFVGAMMLTTASPAHAQEIERSSWNVNNWRKNDATATLKDEHTPDDKYAIDIAFEGTPTPNVVAILTPKVLEQWPDTFESVTIQCKGDGSGKVVQILFQHNRNLHVATIKLEHQGWKTFTFTKLAAKKGTPDLVPNQIKLLIVNANDSCHFALGTPVFTVKAKAETKDDADAKSQPAAK